MSAIELVKAKLSTFPRARFTHEGDVLRVEPTRPDGFPVTLREAPGRWTVHFAGWSERCASAEEAFNLVALGLSDQARLRVRSRGGTDHRWALEVREAGAWREVRVTGFVSLHLWKPRAERVLQNDLLRG